MRALAILALLAMPLSSAWACSCAGPAADPCYRAGLAAAAFSGSVLAITDQPSQRLPTPAGVGPIAASRVRAGEQIRFEPGVRRVRMRVGEVLSGVSPGQLEVEIVTGFGGGDCGYAFQAGAQYVVYAYRDSQGRLATGICSGTRPVEEASKDIAYFRRMAQAPATGQLRVRTGMGDDPGKPGLTVLAEGPAGIYSSQTDSAGVASFPDVQPGEYSVHLESDDVLPGDRKFRVSAKGCVDFTLLRTLQLSGQVTTHDGMPAARIEVQALSARGVEASAMTNVDGRYEMLVLRPGQFQLGVNLSHTATAQAPYPRWFYPGTESPSAAARIEFSGAPDSRVCDFALPMPLKPRRVEGVARMADGRHASMIRLFALDSSKAVVAYETADSNGHFSISLFAGVPYQLHAVWPGNAPAEATSAVPMEIPAGTDPLTLTITLNQPGNSFTKAMEEHNSARR